MLDAQYILVVTCAQTHSYIVECVGMHADHLVVDKSDIASQITNYYYDTNWANTHTQAGTYAYEHMESFFSRSLHIRHSVYLQQKTSNEKCRKKFRNLCCTQIPQQSSWLSINRHASNVKRRQKIQTTQCERRRKPHLSETKWNVGSKEVGNTRKWVTREKCIESSWY